MWGLLFNTFHYTWIMNVANFIPTVLFSSVTYYTLCLYTVDKRVYFFFSADGNRCFWFSSPFIFVIFCFILLFLYLFACCRILIIEKAGLLVHKSFLTIVMQTTSGMGSWYDHLTWPLFTLLTFTTTCAPPASICSSFHTVLWASRRKSLDY